MAGGLSGIIPDWLLGLAGLLGLGSGGGAVGYVRRVNAKAEAAQSTAERNGRAIFGEDDDPNMEGLAPIAHETRERVERLESNLDEFRSETRREHRAVMERLEEMSEE